MAWTTDLVLMFRSLIGDLDSSSFTDDRLQQILVVAAYNVQNDGDFSTTYTIDVSAKTISPDPYTTGDVDFSTLTIYKAACILLGSEEKTEAATAI